jgi:hypothetical protein
MKTTILVSVLLAFSALAVSIGNFRESAGVDFYQYWGVAKAQKWRGGKLKSPYVEPAQYAAVLNAHADGSSDSRLKKANQSRRELELAQTPLCYTIFAFLPANYSLAFGIFQATQIILLLAATIMLGLSFSGNRTGLLPLALLLLIFYQPLLSDLRVGNLNSIQLFALVLLTFFADRVLAGPSGRNPLGYGIIFMGALVFLTLLKPNLALVTLLLAATLWIRQGTAVFGRAALAAACLAVILMALSCLQFHSWQVWLDWYRYARGLDAGKLLSFIPQGNYALVILVAKSLGLGVSGVTAFLAAALVGSGVGALRLTVPPGRRGFPELGRTAVRSLQDPYLSAAMGVTATLALAPLVWFHYYVLSLFPALWLLWGRQHWGLAAVAAGFSILLTSGAVSNLLVALFGYGSWLPYSYALGWVPLWAGLLAAIAFNRESPLVSDLPVITRNTTAGV